MVRVKLFLRIDRGTEVNIIIENEIGKVSVILDKYHETLNPMMWFKNVYTAATIIAVLPKPVKLRLFIDGELDPGCGSGLGFLNRMIDDWPALIERVVVCSYSDAIRKEMAEVCAENLIAVELLPLPFSF